MSIRQRIAALLAAGALLAAVDVAEAQTLAFADPGTTNLRAGPGTNYAWLGSVQGGTQLDLHYCQYGWCFVTVYGRDAWIVQTRVSIAGAQAPVVVPVPVYPPSYQPYYGFSFGYSNRDYPRYRHRSGGYDHGQPHDQDNWVSEDPGGGSPDNQYWKRQQYFNRQQER